VKDTFAKFFWCTRGFRWGRARIGFRRWFAHGNGVLGTHKRSCCDRKSDADE